MTKEDTVPEGADRPVFHVSPVLFAVPTLVVLAVIPFGDNSFLGKLNIGVLFVLGITSVNSIVIFMAGWASRNKYAMFGAMRGVALLVSYEVPMALSVTGVLIVAGSMSLFDIVEAQRVPFLLVQPLAFLVFMIASLAEISRAPLDQIEAESELGSGYHTEYSGMKFGIFQLIEFMAPLITALIIATVFLGGTRGFDPVPGQVWFLVKVFGVVFIMLWTRATWPRLRVDQIMGLAWKALFFMAITNMFLVAVEVQLLQDDTGKLTTDDMWLMAAINWVVAVTAVVLIANLMGQRRLAQPTPVPSPLADMTAEAD
jgi:NADH-quinone oxidoreductase subunit H